MELWHWLARRLALAKPAVSQQQQQQAPLTREQKKAKDNKRKKAGGAGQERATTRLNLKGALMASQAALAAALAQVKDLQAGHPSSAQTAEKQQL